MSRNRYNPVATLDTPSDDYSKIDKKPKTTSEVLKGKMEQLLWVMLASGVFVYADMWKSLQDERFHGSSFWLGCIFYFLSFTVFLYITFILPYFYNVRIDYKSWQNTAPRAIPFASACGLIGFICFNVSFWPIYHALTPFIMFIELLGFVALVGLF